MKSRLLNILYINLGDNFPYTYDKIAGRVLNWAKLGNSITLLVPKLSQKTVNREILSQNAKLVKTITLPFSNHIANSPFKIILLYLSRMVFSPAVLFKTPTSIDVAISNSAFFVDIAPALILKLFGKCKHWILIMDSVIPSPTKRGGNKFINLITYVESVFVGWIANLFSDMIFTVNPELKIAMIKRGISKNKIYLSQNGLFLKDIQNIKPQTQNVYQGVYQGRISDNKGTFDLIDVWKKVVEEIPDAKLAIMGSGLEENISKLKIEIENNHLGDNISYLGFTPKPEKYQIMKNSKVFLYLSKVNADESWGISLMEALACGLPAISYDLPIYKHIYLTDALIRLKNGDIKSVARKVITLLNNSRLRRNLSQEAHNFVQKFDWKIIADKDMEIINVIMKDGKKN